MVMVVRFQSKYLWYCRQDCWYEAGAARPTFLRAAAAAEGRQAGRQRAVGLPLLLPAILATAGRALQIPDRLRCATAGLSSDKGQPLPNVNIFQSSTYLQHIPGWRLRRQLRTLCALPGPGELRHPETGGELRQRGDVCGSGHSYRCQTERRVKLLGRLSAC